MQRSASRAAPPHWAVRVGTVGPVTGGAIAWHFRGHLRLTAIVKASFAFAPDAPMSALAPADLQCRDEHVGGDLRQSLIASSDLAPYLLKTDVLLTGHTVSQATPRHLRLAISGRQLVLDKTIQVVGHSPMTGPTQVPLIYEEAFGGSGNDENPVGNPSPRLIDPMSPRHPACFAPVSQGWPARSQLLAGFDRRMLEGAEIDLPSTFDWNFFQAAPGDQRVDYLRGDEWILLSGLHPTLPVLRTKLPGLRGIAEVYGLPAASNGQVEMNLDTLHIDIDRQRCSVVFRGSILLPTGTALASLNLALGIKGASVSGVRPMENPATREPLSRVQALDSTRMLDEPLAHKVMTTRVEDEDASRESRPQWPFAVAEPSAHSNGGPEIAGAPWAKSAAKPAPPVHNDLNTTFPLEFPAAARAVIAALSPKPDMVAPARAPLPPQQVVREIRASDSKVEPPPLRETEASVALPEPAIEDAMIREAVMREAANQEATSQDALIPSVIPESAPPVPAAPQRKEEPVVYTTASPERERFVAPPEPPPPRRESEASEAVRANVYGKFGARRK